MIEIKQMVITKKKYQDREIENIFGLGNDNKVYTWKWAIGDWEEYAKAIEVQPE